MGWVLVCPAILIASWLIMGHSHAVRLDMSRVSFSKREKGARLSYKDMELALHRSSLRLHYLQAQQQQESSVSKARVFVAPSHAEFITTVSVGTPPAAFTTIVDTGSDLMWVQCQPCQQCHTANVFDPSSSSSYQPLPCSSSLCSQPCDSSTSDACPYKVSYGDQSYTEGVLVQDVLTLPDVSGQEQSLGSVVFGCGVNNAGISFAGADGLLGLGKGRLSLLSQLGISQLAYCLQSIEDPISKTSPLFLGPPSQRPPPATGGTVTTSMVTNAVRPSFYYVKLNGISVGGELVGNIPAGSFDIQADGSGGMIFDSGTTFTYLQSEAYAAVEAALKAAITATPVQDVHIQDQDLSLLCYRSTSLNLDTVPSLTFHFENANLDLPPLNYFTSFSSSGVGLLTCLTLFPSNLPISIFGNHQQQNFFVLYDLQAQTISLTPTQCDSM